MGDRILIGSMHLSPELKRKLTCPTLTEIPGVKAIGHGDAEVSYGSGEKPKYGALRRAIATYYGDLLRPLLALRKAVFAALPLVDATKAAEPEPFAYAPGQRRAVTKAVDKFLTELVGPDRTREGFVNGGIESDTPDGIIQRQNQQLFAIGIARASDLVNGPMTVPTARESPAVRAMLENAFTRLSEGGRLRLEGVHDDIHSILVSATEAGLNPLETAHQLSAQFDQYEGYEFQRLARTEAAYAAEEGTREQFREFGVERVGILIAAGACPICQAYDGQMISIDDEDNQPPYHPNCLCSATPVA